LNTTKSTLKFGWFVRDFIGFDGKSPFFALGEVILGAILSTREFISLERCTFPDFVEFSW